MVEFRGDERRFPTGWAAHRNCFPSRDVASTGYIPERYYTAVPILSERAKAALSRLQANLDEMERLANEARALMAEIQQDGETCSPSVRERTRDALRQLREPGKDSRFRRRAAP